MYIGAAVIGSYLREQRFITILSSKSRTLRGVVKLSRGTYVFEEDLKSFAASWSEFLGE